LIDETIREEHLIERCLYNKTDSNVSSQVGSYSEPNYLEEILSLKKSELNFDEIWVEHRYESVYDMEMQEKSLWEDFTNEMN
jgi:hypothetical protein